MRHCNCLPSLLAIFVVIAAASMMGAASATAADAQTSSANAECKDTQNGGQTLRPKFAGLSAPAVTVFDVSDQRAALESVQYALTEISDGASYVWHRGHGKLSGVVQPTQSFKDANGKICRHFVVMLASGTYTKRTETVACRTEDGIWQLDG
ncbi:RT0821/Lpp0805 family surface protein [Filomicrobium sp.]|uniref:RT0821/Lpp0805 family surface protein n=1 Tax=Filomicrobium sp. TaxID=2024831 RepID=UPI00258A49E7|nr:RT0821/Lpp0805 family surface protein [Filomicrobium sp.]